MGAQERVGNSRRRSGPGQSAPALLCVPRWTAGRRHKRVRSFCTSSRRPWRAARAADWARAAACRWRSGDVTPNARRLARMQRPPGPPKIDRAEVLIMLTRCRQPAGATATRSVIAAPGAAGEDQAARGDASWYRGRARGRALRWGHPSPPPLSPNGWPSRVKVVRPVGRSTLTRSGHPGSWHR